MFVARCLMLAVLLAPAAAAEIMAVTDPAGDVDYQNDPPQNPKAQQIYEALDLLSAWIGDETVEDFAVGLTTVSNKSTSHPSSIIQHPFMLVLQFSWAGMEYQLDFGSCLPNEAELRSRVAGQRDFGSSICVPASVRESNWTARIPKELVLDSGGLPLRAGSIISDWFAVTEKLEQGSRWRTGDRAPDKGFGEPLVTRLGNNSFGPWSVGTPTAFRASNGGPDTMIFPVRLENRGPAGDVLLQAMNVPENWEVRVASRVTVPAGGNVTLPVLVATGSAHEHGTVQKFTLRIQSVSGNHEGKVELGINYLAIPQLSGHHPRLYLHTGTPQGTLSQTVDGWLNTVEDDARDARGPLPARSSGTGLESNAMWTLPLDPALLIGMDFDLAKEGLFTTKLTPQVPSTAARLVATLWHCNPHESGGTSITTCPGGSWFKLAGGQSATRAVDPGTTYTFEVPLAVEPYADLVPYLRESNVALRIEFWWAGPDGNFATRPVLQAGSTSLTLPLLEYRDPVDMTFEEVATLRLTPLGPYDLRANAGQRVWVPFQVENLAAEAQMLRLGITGDRGNWVSWQPASTFELKAGSKTQVVFTVDVPVGAVAGQFVEAVAMVEPISGKGQAALSKLRVVIVDEPLESQAKPELDLPSPARTPGLSIAILAVFVVIAAAVRRRA
jgi:hypothetical protein